MFLNTNFPSWIKLSSVLVCKLICWINPGFECVWGGLYDITAVRTSTVF